MYTACLYAVWKFVIMNKNDKGGFTMLNEQHYFEQGVDLATYMSNMATLKNDSYRVYNAFDLPEDPEFIEAVKRANIHILVITEDWCGDAMMNNAILRNIAEAAELDVRCVMRNQHIELMDAYLTNGSRSIPLYLFLNERGEVTGQWGPRAPELQAFVMAKWALLPPKTDDEFSMKQRELFMTLSEEYASNEQFWQYVYEDLRTTLLNIL